MSELQPEEQSAPVQPLVGAQRHEHAVQFYESEEFLARKVADFLATGLKAREAAVLIATDAHRDALCSRLSAAGIDVEAACRSGNLCILDARETLLTFMNGTVPDRDRFKSFVGGVVERALLQTASGRIRAFGEMVDLLWRDGNPQAAIQLEEFWNDLATIHPFSLLCAYRLGNFYKEADGAAFQQVCRTHTHVVPAESYAADDDDDDERLREVTVLQQRARALENEVAIRRQLEEALRVALREQRASEVALRRSEQQLKDFVENAAEGLHWVGADGVIQWANRAELEMLGYTAEEYVGHPIARFYADREVIDDILARLGRNETLRDQEARMVCKDGSIRHVVINSNVCWEDGKFLHTRCFTRDVTERKRAEARLREAEEERARFLEREQAARAEAESATRAKDEFLAMLGHELRNPLSPIVTALQLMRLRGDQSAPRERAIIERQVKHLVRLVDDLLDVSRITRGKVELRCEPLEIADVVAKAVEMAGPLLEERSHHLIVDVPRGRGLRVSGDAERLPQVFCNLLANAAKYTDRGGRITISAAIHGPTVEVRVTDNGAGIDPALLPRVFDLFTQAKQTLDRSQGGLGIGLAIVRSLVALHGGSVSVRSEGPGRGSEFTVELPVLGRGAAAAGERRDDWHEGRAGKGSRILVVDDNEDAATLTADSLRLLGYEAEAAHDGPSALRIAAGFNPEVAILDIGLPVMDGYELGRRLLSAYPGIRLIALTGYSQDSSPSLSQAAGFHHHLVKPVALDRLALLLQEIERQGRTASC